MKHGSLFSGIGGFDLAAEWMGWENVFHCEWNLFGQKVLKHYWPNAISYDDITKTDFTIHRGNIDILTGGFPCQPYSVAGKRLGKEDDRHLWPEMLRVVREIQPAWVVGENVFGLINWNGGMVFDEVQTDLEAEGYEVQPYVLPACAVNAPHRRDRIWFVAYSYSYDARRSKHGEIGQEAGSGEGKKEKWKRVRAEFERTGDKRNVTNAKSQRCSTLQERPEEFQSQKRSGLHGRGGNGLTRKTDWSDFPTQPPVCIGNDGFSEYMDGITFSKWRKESIKAAENAIVPQIAYEIFKAIEKFELSQNNMLKFC